MKKKEISGGPIRRRLLAAPGEKALSLICGQLAIVLSSGMPLAAAVRLAAGEAGTARLREVLQCVAEEITAGSALAAALERWAIFPPILIETVQAGEESGTLETAFQSLSGYFDQRARLRGKVAAALTYPALVAALSVVVILVITTRLVPALSGIFAELGTELPRTTRMLIELSDFLTRDWPLLTALLAGVLLLILALRSGERGRLLLGRLRLHLPLLGSVDRVQDASRFAASMATMLRAGLPMLRSIRITARTMTNSALAREASDCARGVEEGRELSACLGKGAFPPMLAELAGVGEETRTLAETFELAAGYFERELVSLTDRIIRYIEPLTILAVAVFALFLLLSVYLPMLSLYGGIS